MPGPKLLVDLANMDDDRIPRFRKRWGHLYGHQDRVLLQRRDELRLLWRSQAIHRVLPKVIAGSADQADEEWLEGFDAATSRHTAEFKESWVEWRKSGQTGLLQECICEYWLRQNEVKWSVHWKTKYIGADPENLCQPCWRGSAFVPATA